MNTISKSKKKYDAKRALVIKKIAYDHSVSESFVRMALRGDRESDSAEMIKREFNKLYAVLDNTLK